MLPVTGPHVITTTQYATNQVGVSYLKCWRRQQIHRQKPPFNLVLPYVVEDTRVLSFSPETVYDYVDASFSEPFDNAILEQALNLAYGKLSDSIGESADLGATVGEARQSGGMIGDRLGQAGRVFNQASRGNFAKAAKELKYAFTKKAVKRIAAAKTVADFWLETWFGWKPLLTDISNAVEVLQNPTPPKKKIRGVGKASSTRSYHPPVSILDGMGSTQQSRWDFAKSAKVVLGATVEVESPNLNLANRLGFVNAAAVAWELVPWSFLVDWFVNVGQVIGSMTTFIGLKVTQAYTSTLQKVVEVGSRLTVAKYWYNDGQNSFIQQNLYMRSYSRQNLVFRRELGISGPVLRFQAPNWPLTRAATAGALLVQQLTRRH